MSYLATWLESDDGGKCFVSHARLIQAHNPDCPSMENLWLPRRGGYSCLSDSIECDVCNVTFLWDGIVIDDESCPYTTHFLCRCCTQTECGCTE